MNDNKKQNLVDDFYCYSPNKKYCVKFSIFWDDSPFNSVSRFFLAKISGKDDLGLTIFEEMDDAHLAFVKYDENEQREVRWRWSSDSRYFFFFNRRDFGKPGFYEICLDFLTKQITVSEMNQISPSYSLEPSTYYSLF